jgi:hypothetical protein
MITTHAKRFALSTAILAACAAGRAPAQASDVHKALAPCSGIANSADRLACYDKLAGRASPPPATPSAAAAASAASAPAAVRTEEEFGRSKVQEAAKSNFPPKIKTVTAKVAGFGRSPNLRTQITLDNGQIWEYQDDPDPLLSIGDTVTIKHAMLGSFMLLTPTKVSHRVRRIN